MAIVKAWDTWHDAQADPESVPASGCVCADLIGRKQETKKKLMALLLLVFPVTTLADYWRDAQSDPVSTPAKLLARMSECEVNLNRSAFDTYK